MTKEQEQRFDERFQFAVKYKQDGTEIVDFDYHQEELKDLKFFISQLIQEAKEEGRKQAVEYIRENFNDEYLEKISALPSEDEATEEEESAGFWMMFNHLLQEALNQSNKI